MRESVVNVTGAQEGNDGFHSTDESRPEILVPLDFTPCSREALHAAVAYAQRLHAPILLLHVIDVALDFLNTAGADVPRIEHQIREQAAAEFAWAMSTYKDTEVSFETLVVEGLPAEQILNTAQARHVGLIVMGRHPKPRRWNLFHRQTVKAVMDEAECEVILVTHKGARKPIEQFQTAPC